MSKKAGEELTKERAIQELKKTQEKIAKLQKKESKWVEYIREKEKEEAMAILDKFKISPEELGVMLEEHKAENKKLLLQSEARNLSEMEQNSGFLETNCVDKSLKESTELG